GPAAVPGAGTAGGWGGRGIRRGGLSGVRARRAGWGRERGGQTGRTTRPPAPAKAGGGGKTTAPENRATTRRCVPPLRHRGRRAKPAAAALCPDSLGDA